MSDPHSQPGRARRSGHTRSRKKKKGAGAGVPGWVPAAAFLSLFLLASLAVLWIGLRQYGTEVRELAAAQQEPDTPFEAPTSFVREEHPSDTFSFERPTSWEIAREGGARDEVFVTLKGDGATVDIRSFSPERFSAGDREIAPTATGSETHVEASAYANDLLSDYREFGTEELSTEMGPAEISPIEGREVVLIVKGLRATLRKPKVGFRILCTCEPSRFDALRPVFERIVSSMKLPY